MACAMSAAARSGASRFGVRFEDSTIFFFGLDGAAVPRAATRRDPRLRLPAFEGPALAAEDATSASGDVISLVLARVSSPCRVVRFIHFDAAARKSAISGERVSTVRLKGVAIKL
jgi:hypothetical protein